MTDGRVPVAAIGGFLGAGKTTLINHLLSRQGVEPTAVIVNEFGQLGIDGRLIRHASGGVVELTNGCICCEVRGDLTRTVRQLLRRRARWFRSARFERIWIELSGLARPGPVVQTFQVQRDLLQQCRWMGLVTLVHSAHIEAQLVQFPEAVEQVAVADQLILNHRDSVSVAVREGASEAIALVNPSAAIVEAEYGKVELGVLWTGHQQERRIHTGEGVHHHGPVQSLSLVQDDPIDLPGLKLFLQFLSSRFSGQILRVKGLFCCAGVDKPVLAQGVYQWLELGPTDGKLPAQSQLVIIGRDLKREEIERGWALLADSS